jgi:hypothetical protein
MTDTTLAATLEPLREVDDLAVTFGGLGDPLLHADWPAPAAKRSGPIAVETDLLCDTHALRTLADVDVVKIRLNADTAETYRKLMGVDGFDQATANIRRLLEMMRQGAGPRFIVPALVKCRDNVHETESFYDRWVSACGAALIEAPSTGAGQVADPGVIDMAPPRRFACRQLIHRMTVHADGVVPRCDQDWLGREAAGNVNDEPIDVLWRRLQDVRCAHEAGRYAGLCAGCRAWHRA